ncbi:MAG: hypothetical protein KGQ52_10085 [Alphaproteobacteria bacterium]|nr:hypothetical protein [Alphaproteobacteria bacterium]
MRPNQPEGKAPDTGASADNWARFRRLMLWVGLATLLALAGGLWWLWASGAPARWELWVAAAGAIAGTMLLTGGLMGLVFLSSRSGHDAAVGQADPQIERWPYDQ